MFLPWRLCTCDDIESRIHVYRSAIKSAGINLWHKFIKYLWRKFIKYLPNGNVTWICLFTREITYIYICIHRDLSVLWYRSAHVNISHLACIQHLHEYSHSCDGYWHRMWCEQTLRLCFNKEIWTGHSTRSICVETTYPDWLRTLRNRPIATDRV